MAFKILLSKTALKELETSVDWYNERQYGLGKQFISALDSCLLAVAENPEMYTIKVSGYREAPLKKFPFLIVYNVIKKNKVIRVLHVFHTKRNPTSKM